MSLSVAVAYCASASAAGCQPKSAIVHLQCCERRVQWRQRKDKRGRKKQEKKRKKRKKRKKIETPTQWHVVIALNGHILRLFDVVYALENGQTMADTADAHALEILVQQRDESFANNVVV